MAEVIDPDGEHLTVVDDAGQERPVAVCAREGHLPTIGLRHDLARLAMVADCTRCGAVLMLDQVPHSGRRNR